MEHLRRTLWAAAGLMGLVVILRMFAGPFELAGIPVNAPLNPEGIFGFLVTLLVAWRVPAQAPLARPRLAALLGATAAVAAISHIRVLGLYFLSDDFILIQQANAWRWANLVPVFTSGGGDGFFRPIGLVSLAVNALWADTEPRPWHASAVALHAANSVMVAWLAARLGLPTMNAFLAGALFAVHGTHLEAAAWIAGRFDLLAAFFTLAGLLLFLSGRGWARPAALLCCLLAVWSKEAAFVFPVLALCLTRLERRPPLAAAPFFAVAGMAFVYRWVLLGGIGGYVSAEPGRPAVFALGLASTAKVVFARLWTSLYFPLNWSRDPSPLLAVSALAMVAAVLWMACSSRPGPVARFAFAALLASVLPALHLLGGAADLSGGRLLYLPSVWFCLLLAAAMSSPAGAAALLLFHTLALQHNLISWQRASQQVHRICQAAAEGIVPAQLPADIEGVPAFRNGFRECVDLARQGMQK